MPWSRSAEYAPLPTSTSPSSPLDAPRLGFPIESQSRSRSRRAYYALGACCALLLLSSVFVVPEEALPVRVSSAVGASREAFEAAKSSWGWQTQEELDAEITQLDVEEAIERVGGEVSEASTGEEAGGMDATKAEPDLLSVEEDIACPEEVKKQVGEPEFWTVRASTTALNDTTYAIVPRSPFPTDLSRACLSQAVFSARLVAFDDALLRSPERETLYALPRPTLYRGFDSYDIHLDREAAIPLKRYELEVTLEFGYFPGSTRGICGSDKVCQERILSDELGGQLDYVGGKINVEEDVGAVPAGTLIDPQDTVPLCDSLSSIRGYWSSLSYHPFQPAPCSLFDPNFPLPFAPPATKEQDNAPLWIHFVGDSNTRNMFSQFLISLGNGHKINAPQVIDSKTHNGTHASFASRWRSGEIPSEGDGSVPDVIVTWSWWYESTPSSRSQENGEVLWNANLRDNRDDLLRLADTNLADYLEYANLGAATRGNPSLSNLAVTLRPQRTYLSLGSHSERLSVPGAVSSLDYLLDETTGLSRAKRDAANLRVFTTTNVNPSYIPLDRFPHQDLVRNNAFISAKNSLTRSRPEFTEAASSTRRGGRVIDVEALTNGITVGADWMKPGKKGRSPDAVHFREEVYDEWVRLVWTDLVQGIDVSTTEGVPERRRWKKSRIEDWDDEDEF